VGKWGNNNGQACIAPDYILAEDSIAPRVVNRYIGSAPSP
jgi:aldehyde dehydrogenase (NAD+)